MSSAYDYLSNSVLWLPFTLLLLGVFTQPNYEAAVDTGFPSERKSKVLLLKALMAAGVLIIVEIFVGAIFLYLDYQGAL